MTKNSANNGKAADRKVEIDSARSAAIDAIDQLREMVKQSVITPSAYRDLSERISALVFGFYDYGSG